MSPSPSGEARRGFFLLFYLFTLLLFLVSCSESDETDNEFADWQSRNATYWNTLYTATQQKISGGDTSWRIIRSWAKTEGAAKSNTDYIIAHVEREGSGGATPLYTDSVQVYYRGRYIPTASYPSGLVFDENFTGELDVAVAKPTTQPARQQVDGFTTALMQMHAGDRWTVYIPYTLGYGETASSDGVIPAYSTLIFDLTLARFWHP